LPLMMGNMLLSSAKCQKLIANRLSGNFFAATFLPSTVPLLQPRLSLISHAFFTQHCIFAAAHPLPPQNCCNRSFTQYSWITENEFASFSVGASHDLPLPAARSFWFIHKRSGRQWSLFRPQVWR
jgi:hypothetical protein